MSDDNYYNQSPPFKTHREAIDARDELARLRKEVGQLKKEIEQLKPKPAAPSEPAKCHKCGQAPCEGSHHCDCCKRIRERVREIASTTVYG